MSFNALAGPPGSSRFDTDGDGILDARDNCPAVSNAAQLDRDRDGLGDACDPDRDGDGVFNIFDNCPTLTNRSQADRNLDGIGDACDGSEPVELAFEGGR